MHKFIMIVCCLSVMPSMAAAATYDGSAPLLCAALTIQECANDTGECHRRTAEEVNIPQFIKVDVAQKTITSTGSDTRQSPIQVLGHLQDRLLMQGGRGPRGWSMVIAKETGKLSASVVTDEVGFIIFGACTPQP